MITSNDIIVIDSNIVGSTLTLIIYIFHVLFSISNPYQFEN